MREQNEVIAGKGQADNQFASVSTRKCAACERPETNSPPARPRCAHGSIQNAAVLHGRALIVGPTVPDGIITLGCSVAPGLSEGKVLRFRGNLPGDLCGRTPGGGPGDGHFNIALHSRTGFLSFTFVASARLSPIVLLTSAQIVIVHRSDGYWTSVQSIDRMR